MKKLLTILSLAAVVTVGMPTVVPADQFDKDYARLVSKWQHDRDELVTQIVQTWLRGGTVEAQSPDLQRLVQLDVRLATDPTVELYVTAFSDPNDKQLCINEIVLRFLRNNDIEFNSARLFEGRTFYLLKEDARPNLGFMNWDKKK